jgi:hypothetical protein
MIKKESPAVAGLSNKQQTIPAGTMSPLKQEYL